MEFTFDLHINSGESLMNYVCRSCGVTEHGGSVPNPGLYGRMQAHLREAHDVSRDQQFAITHIETSPPTAEVHFRATQKEPSTESAPSATEDLPRAPSDERDTQWMRERQVYKSFIVDTNCVNSRGGNAAMNQLEEWSRRGLITLLTTEIAQNEMFAGNDEQRTQKAYKFIFTVSEVTSDFETRTLREIEQVLFPDGAKTQNQRNDVEIVFNAGKYVRPLITTDGASKSQPGGILGNRAALQKLGMTVLTPSEAAALVRKEIEFRDESARKMADLTGEKLPEWVGTD